ncbi:MAG: alkylhydroperoxidase [Caulobacterales bacterium 68-7]|nr:carboxymuconolactone decarboxylase family protein [Caulobacterales bacterium]OJU09243.1 MAG: alkylhydroperoxidase [Caulobacterales bacterium 68-7]
MNRLNPWSAAPAQMKMLVDYSMAISEGFDTALKHLVKIRASQINGCAMCLHMHTQEARKDGEREESIYLLDAWREAEFYTPRERAALAWTEALSRLGHDGVSDEAYAAVTAEFSEEEVVHLTMLVNAINAFNRIGVGFQRAPLRAPPAKAA